MTRTSMRARYAGIWCTENCGTPKTDGCRCSRPQMVLPFPFMHRVHVDQIGRENAVGLRAAVADGVVATDAGELVLVLVLVLEPPQAASAVTKKNAAAAKRSGRPAMGLRRVLDVSAEQWPEVDGRLAVLQNCVAISLVDVEVPAAGRYRGGHARDHPGLVDDVALAVGDEVHHHVLDCALAGTASEVDVGGVVPGGQAARIHGDGQCLGTGVVRDGGLPIGGSEAGAGRADLDRLEREGLATGVPARHGGLGDRLVRDIVALAAVEDH